MTYNFNPKTIVNLDNKSPFDNTLSNSNTIIVVKSYFKLFFIRTFSILQIMNKKTKCHLNRNF